MGPTGSSLLGQLGGYDRQRMLMEERAYYDALRMQSSGAPRYPDQACASVQQEPTDNPVLLLLD